MIVKMRPSPPPLARLPRKQPALFHLREEDEDFTRFSASVTEPSYDVSTEGEESNVTRVKCVLVGDGAIGKTSLIVSYTTNGYPTEYEPTAFDNYAVVVTVVNQPIRLQLCDTAGQDDFDSLRPLCYPDTDVFLLCFSVVAPASYHNITDKWVPEIRKHAPDAALILIGTQCDLRGDVRELIELARYQEKPITEEQAQQTMQQIGALQYIECSALTQVNLKEVFDSAILAALEKHGLLHRITSKKDKKKHASRNKDENKRWKRFCCLA